ncbi:carboxypeptidase-like regulatory domain-containing protein [Hymenobacter sp. B81]|uniref:carboxypeptidase-like regulatory domain-containing protein n=1 Tax=Hymenobacter sp. B81 TaxID=3344878 RepID=UPI0037DDC4BE
MFRPVLLGLLGVLFSVVAHAQQPLAQARQTSFLTKVFRLTNEQARYLYEHDLRGARPEFFRQPVDSFPTDSAYRRPRRPLPPGYYLVAHTEGPELVYWLRSETDRQVLVLDNQVDLTLLVRDSLGRLLPDAQVALARRRVPYDAATGTYRRPRGGRAGLLAVSYRGRTTYHALKQTFPYARDEYGEAPRWRRTSAALLRGGRRVLFGFPLGYLSRPVRRLVGDLRQASYVTTGPVGLLRSVFSEDVREERRQDRANGYRNTGRGRREWTSYVAFSKPQYRPRADTLQLKVRLLRRPDGRPARRRLTLWLGGSAGQDKKLAVLKPRRPGTYQYALPLTDTLGLRADTYVQLRLATRRGMTLASGQFRLADYELKNTRYALRVGEPEHRRGAPQALIMRGTDANELNLADARVQLSLVPVGAPGAFAGRQLFVPDTLWRHAGPLAAAGETRLEVPAARFPAADFRYEVHAAFLNADNERHRQTVTVPFRYDPGQLSVTLAGDSVQLRYLYLGQSRPHRARLEVASGSELQAGPARATPVRLPLTVPLDARATDYTLRDSLGRRAGLELNEQNAGLALRSERTADSIFLAIDNPRRLRFWCYVYRANRLVYRRYAGPDWQLALPARTAEPWYVSVHYLWGEQMQSREYNVPLHQRNLLIHSDMPAVAYPGQRLQLNFTVTDGAGRPVPQADLTAYAYTSKFDQAAAPALPGFERPLRGRASLRRFRVEAAGFENAADQTRHQPLRWREWAPRLGLDSLRFYQFLYPEFGQFHEYHPAPGGLTQLAPFVVDSGRVRPPIAVYVDGVPVYVRDVNQQDPYSFVADSGYHTVSIRTARHLVTLRDVYLRHLHKLTLSIDVNQRCQELAVESRPVFLAQEQFTLSRSLLMVDDHVPIGTLLRQGNRLQALAQPAYGRPRLAGPFRPDSVLLRQADGLRAKFVFEPLFRYSVQPGLLKLRSIEPTAFGPLSGYGFPAGLPLAGFAHTEAALRPAGAASGNGRNSPLRFAFDSYWNPRLTVPEQTPAGQGRLEIRLPDRPKPDAWPRAHFLLLTRPAAPGFQRLQPGLGTVHALPPGRYRVAVLLADSSLWLPTELVEVRADGVTYLQLRATDWQPPGPRGRSIGQLVRRLAAAHAREEAQPARREINVARPVTAPGHWVALSGQVTDRRTGEGLAGATVLVKGTTIGVSTNADGSYSLTVPPNARALMITSVGYLAVERAIDGTTVNVSLAGDTKQLSEVVVTGYGGRAVRDITGSVTVVSYDAALQGRVAGVQITGGAPGGGIRIRGVNSRAGAGSPLIIVDGLPFVGRVQDLDPAAIASAQTLTGALATGIYGSRAANGVIIITTKADSPERLAQATDLLAGSSARDPRLALRRRFADVGWWQPTLVTDAQGRARATITLPDDVTGWDAFVLGSDDRGRTGSATGRLRSFKALLAELAVPRFLVAGDRVQVLGKTRNYLPDSAQVTTAFRVNGAELRRRQHRVAAAALDTLTVTAPAADSLQLTFGLTQASGYQDGEQRPIPVLPAGTREQVGTFLTLAAPDTLLQLPAFDPALGTVTLRLESDPLPAILSEIRHLQAYAYLCNEQAASKLKALLLEQRIRGLRGETFQGERQVNYLIRKLQSGRRPEGLWGTWPTSSGSGWATAHVLEALLSAEAAGFRVALERDKVGQYLLGELDASLAAGGAPGPAGRRYFGTPDDPLRLLQLLHRLGTPVDYRTYLDRLARRESGRQPLDRYLALTELRQQLRLPYQLDTLRRYRLATAVGGVRYDDTLRPGLYYRHLLASAVGSSLLAYRVLRRHGGHEAELTRLRVYLLGLRSAGHWRSTYEAAQILETIGPDLFAPGLPAAAARVELSGAVSQHVTQFPFEVQLSPTGAGVSLRKQGTLPVYASAHQVFWNPVPAARATPFGVSTTLAGQAGTRVKLRAGQPAELVVTVESAAEARYVLVEVPIPAGCSYGDQALGNSFEVHREYLRHQAGIFIDLLPAGRHTFRIALQPRYRGRYTVNPAKAEMMYFPTRFGRSASKQCEVE